MIGTGAASVRDMVIPARYGAKEDKKYTFQQDTAQKKTKSILYLQRISGGSWNGPGRELHGTIWGGPYSKTATGQKTLNTGRGPYLRGPAELVQPRYALGGHSARSIMVMNTILYSYWAGTHQPHRKVVGLVCSVLLITGSLAIWLSN